MKYRSWTILTGKTAKHAGTKKISWLRTTSRSLQGCLPEIQQVLHEELN